MKELFELRLRDQVGDAEVERIKKLAKKTKKFTILEFQEMVCYFHNLLTRFHHD
jgi:hypothetical protein